MRDGKPFQRSNHHLERAQPALRGLLEESFVKLEKAFEIARIEESRHIVVEYGTLGRVAVRPVWFESMGQISAGHEHTAPMQIDCGLRDAAAERAVRFRSKTRKPYAHESITVVDLVHEEERNERRVVELAVGHAAAADGRAVLAGAGGHRCGESRVVGHGHGRFPRAEPPHVPTAGVAGGYMEAIPEKRRMGRDDDDGVGGVRGNTTRHLLVGGDGFRNGTLLTAANRWNDEGRMRDDVSGYDAHWRLLPRMDSRRFRNDRLILLYALARTAASQHPLDRQTDTQALPRLRA